VRTEELKRQEERVMLPGLLVRVAIRMETAAAAVAVIMEEELLSMTMAVVEVLLSLEEY
jgi:hypothetical protein